MWDFIRCGSLTGAFSASTPRPLEVADLRCRRYLDAGAKTCILGLPWLDVERVTSIAKDVIPLLR
jgi:hypothetical protein